MVKSEGGSLRRVIVCSPRREYFRPADLQAHNIAAIADPELSRKQHDGLKSLLRQARARVVDLTELRRHPNSVFVRDTALITPRGYIQLRMGLPSRRGEERWMTRVLDGLGIPFAGRIRAPGTVEGGDVILAWPVAFIGLSARTNEAGAKQLAQRLERMGYEIRIISLPPEHLHLGGAMSLVGPKTVLCCRGIFPDSFFKGFQVIAVPDESATSGNVICLGKGEVIAEKGNKAAIRALRRAGFTVHTLDLSEFIKGRGGPTCLILPVDRK